MTDTSRLFHHFLLRLPVFTMLLAVFNVLLLMTAPSRADGSPVYSWLLLIPFTLLFMSKNLPRKAGVALSLQIGVYAVSLCVIYLTLGTRHSGYLSMIAVTVFWLYFLRVYYRSGESSLPALSIGLHVFLAFLFSFGQQAAVGHVAAVFVPAALLNEIALYGCRYYANLFYITQARWWPHQSQQMARRFEKRSAGQMFAVLGAAAALLMMVLWLTPVPGLQAKGFMFSLSVNQARYMADFDRLYQAGGGEGAAPVPRTTALPERLPEAREEEPDGVTFEQVTVVLSVVAVGVAGVLCVLWYKHRPVKADTLPDLAEEIIETKATRARRLRVTPRAIPSPNLLVRAAFIRRVNEQRKKGFRLQTFYTAKRITHEIKPLTDMDDLGALYQAARYSGESVTREAARRVGRPAGSFTRKG